MNMSKTTIYRSLPERRDVKDVSLLFSRFLQTTSAWWCAIAQNYQDRFWWHLVKTFKKLYRVCIFSGKGRKPPLAPHTSIPCASGTRTGRSEGDFFRKRSLAWMQRAYVEWMRKCMHAHFDVHVYAVATCKMRLWVCALFWFAHNNSKISNIGIHGRSKNDQLMDIHQFCSGQILIHDPLLSPTCDSVGFLWSQGAEDMCVSDDGGQAGCGDKR